MRIPRIVIAGTHSGVGKTTITSGLMKALVERKIGVQGFKVGPDYIDPSYHTIATGKHSRNIDTWMLNEEKNLQLVMAASKKADIAIIEGVMGLFDGFGGKSDLGSTAHIAKITKTPVILIVDTKSMARSIAALVSGYCNFDPELNVAGIILNKVASSRHLEILKEALEPLNIPIVGHIYRNSKLGMPERHLGLVPAGEMENLQNQLSETAKILKECIDIDKIINIAEKAPDFPVVNTKPNDWEKSKKYNELRIGYAYDKAFSFYYKDGLELLEGFGAQLIPFSPMHAKKLPDSLDGIIIGGGFPELYLKELSENITFSNSLKEAYYTGIPIYAECGGFMYLTEEIIDFQKAKHKMVGLIPGKIVMSKKLVSMGYRTGYVLNDSLIGSQNTQVKGHEFHYSSFTPNSEHDFNWAFIFTNGKKDGFNDKNLLASYLHMHFLTDFNWGKNFLNSCLKNKLAKENE